ncbi:hypothetical protein BDW62DRAFT_17222 [Aspergillus aurantiobrunneus]
MTGIYSIDEETSNRLLAEQYDAIVLYLIWLLPAAEITLSFSTWSTWSCLWGAMDVAYHGGDDEHPIPSGQSKKAPDSTVERAAGGSRQYQPDRCTCKLYSPSSKAQSTRRRPLKGLKTPSVPNKLWCISVIHVAIMRTQDCVVIYLVANSDNGCHSIG